MHVFEVVEINEGPIDWLINNRFVNPPAEGGVARGNPGTPYEGMKFRPRRRGVEIEFPDGSKRVIRNNSRQALERAAVSWNKTNRPKFRVEPRMSAGDPYNRTPRTTPGAGVIPTRDAPTGDYDGPELRATRDAPTGDYDGPELRATRDAPTGDYDGPELRADPEDRIPNPPPSETKLGRRIRQWIRWLMRRLSGAGAGKVAGKLGVVGSLLSTILTGVEVEEELDRMLRVYNNEVERQRSEGVSEADLAWTEAMETERMDTIDNITDLALNALVTTLITAAAGASIWAYLGFIIGSGPVGWIAAIIGGGAIGFYGADGVAKILEWTGIKEDINNWVARVWLPPSAILGLAGWADEVQGSDPETGDISGDDPWFGGDTQPQQAEESLREANNETEVVNKIKKAIQQNPKLRQAFDKGKSFGQEVKQNLN